MDRPPLVTRKGPNGATVAVPRWDGTGRPARLLVIAEQGLGDTIQFARFRVNAAGRCGGLACAAPPRAYREPRPDMPAAGRQHRAFWLSRGSHR